MSQLPLHAQVAADLRRAITDGRLRPGNDLPSESQLCDQYGVSRITIRKALETLEQEGLVVSQQGRPRQVRRRTSFDHKPMTMERLDRPAAEKDAYVQEVQAAGRVPSTTFSMRIEPADAWIADRLKIKPKELVCVREIMRYVDGEPWSLQPSYYPLDVAQQCGLTSAHDIPQGTIRLMAEMGFPEVGYRDEISARMPTPEEARQLQMGTGTPLIDYTRTAATKDRAVRLTHTLYPADRNRLVYEIDDIGGVR
jgi:GntR family transcriptional regulator